MLVITLREVILFSRVMPDFPQNYFLHVRSIVIVSFSWLLFTSEYQSRKKMITVDRVEEKAAMERK